MIGLARLGVTPPSTGRAVADRVRRGLGRDLRRANAARLRRCARAPRAGIDLSADRAGPDCRPARSARPSALRASSAHEERGSQSRGPRQEE